jgi:hypothetical protein
MQRLRLPVFDKTYTGPTGFYKLIHTQNVFLPKEAFYGRGGEIWIVQLADPTAHVNQY